MPNSDPTVHAVVDVTKSGFLVLVCERAGHVITTIDPGDLLDNLNVTVNEHRCSSDTSPSASDSGDVR